MQAFIFVYLSITSRYLGPVFQCSCIPISSTKYKKDTFSFDVVMHFPFQLCSITSSCPSGAFFRYSHFWLLYGFRIGSDRLKCGAPCGRHLRPAQVRRMPWRARAGGHAPPLPCSTGGRKAVRREYTWPAPRLWSGFFRRWAPPHDGPRFRATTKLTARPPAQPGSSGCLVISMA